MCEILAREGLMGRDLGPILQLPQLIGQDRGVRQRWLPVMPKPWIAPSNLSVTGAHHRIIRSNFKPMS